MRIRVSRSGGIAPGRLPWVIGYPVDEAGAPLPQFGVRMSHTLFESILGTMETPPRDERVMAEALIRGIATMPPHKRNGAFIYEFTRIGAQPIKRFKFHYYSTRTENMTFSAPAARKVMNGGEIVGERTMYSGDVPRFDFSHRGGEAGSYRMKRTSLPVAFSADGYQLEQVRRGTLQISGEWFKTLQNLQSTFDLKHLPVIAYNQQGDALVPFWHDRIGEPLERLENGDVLLRFWGEIAAVSYPEPADLVSEAEIR